uniref:Uncharacterized protein n=1 Tax=Romanomermis culicivorax TaxID=13658 RepID=A0A915JFG4_ROMCU
MQAQLKMYESIKTNIDKAAKVSKKYFDQKAHRCKINVNDLVLLTNMSKANKIQPNFIGPFIVTDTAHLDGNIVTIDALHAPSQPQTVSTLPLKPFIPHPIRDAFVTEASGPHQLNHTSPLQ